MTTAALILAAGQGTRLKSDLAKVLHTAAGRTLLRWVLEAVRGVAPDRVVVVVGHQADAVAAEAAAAGLPGLVTVVQRQQRGTGHAVRMAVEQGALDGVDRVLILAGDVPAITSDVLTGLLAAQDGRAAALLTAECVDPAGYGRVLRAPDGSVERIVEHADATAQERGVREINAGVYCVAADHLAREITGLSAANEQGEEYLTDIVAPLVGHGVAAVAAPEEVVQGVNDRRQLALVAVILRQRILERLMLDGVTVVDPATTYVDADVVVERDATLQPGTILEGSTVVGPRATVGPWTRLADSRVGAGATVTCSVAHGAEIGPDATVGPYAHLRPGTVLHRGAKAGGFVEIKNATIGEGSKVPHLSYVGDAVLGAGVNVGAGTITCNYDGTRKHTTVIGDGAFIGSDTMLVAPVEVGPGAYTAAGSTITRDVPADALAVERAEQRTIEGWARRRRDRD